VQSGSAIRNQISILAEQGYIIFGIYLFLVCFITIFITLIVFILPVFPTCSNSTWTAWILVTFGRLISSIPHLLPLETWGTNSAHSVSSSGEFELKYSPCHHRCWPVYLNVIGKVLRIHKYERIGLDVWELTLFKEMVHVQVFPLLWCKILLHSFETSSLNATLWLVLKDRLTFLSSSTRKIPYCDVRDVPRQEWHTVQHVFVEIKMCSSDWTSDVRISARTSVRYITVKYFNWNKIETVNIHY
jgi:hypothetical protein